METATAISISPPPWRDASLRRHAACRVHSRPSLRRPGASAGDGVRSSQPIDVVGIGSRKDAIINFCLASAAASPSICTPRFWTVHSRNSSKVQLVQKHLGTDSECRNLEIPLSMSPCPPALILIASAGNGSDYITGAELLRSVKINGGLTVAILLKPFSFEGRRRQEEVNDLITKLRDCSRFQIVVDAGSILKKHVKTLVEAIECENNAIFMAVNSISVLMSVPHQKLLSTPDGQIKVVHQLDVLDKYGEARISFGIGHNVRTAVTESFFNYPFLGVLKDGIVMLTLMSSVEDEIDVRSTICAFRQITRCRKDIIFSKIFEQNLDPSLVLVSILNIGSPGHWNISSPLPVENDFLGLGLADRSDFWETITQKTTYGCQAGNVFLPKVSDKKQQKVEPNIGQGFHVPQPCTFESDAYGGTSSNEKHEIVTLPVGVKVELLRYDRTVSTSKKDSFTTSTYPLNKTSIGRVYDTTAAAHNSDPTMPRAKHLGESQKKAMLSSRAASMLAAERGPEKIMNPVIEVQYRGGSYKGQCQGGLPDGKGHLTFMDGSFYHGIWRYGKRSGPGTLYYHNGDVFQGIWRDDLTHGKGWLYFHTGDRWFANFWKGKANGEGRFYSNDGSVFFGTFRDGWRDGHSLYIDSKGVRWVEIWNEGILVSKAKVGKETSR